MVLKTDKEKVKTLLSETIRLLCKNGLHFKFEFSVEALVGITLDRDEEFFLSIKEVVKLDNPTPPPPPPPPKSEPRIHHREPRRSSSTKEVKGEPTDTPPTPCSSRKRPAQTVTNNGNSSDLPNLSLGDMQEGEPTFWGHVEADSGGGTPTIKKQRQEDEDDDDDDDNSNSNVITIKGEPGSDSDDDVTFVEGDQEQPITDNSMGDMSGSFMYATPVTSEHSMLGNVASQLAWEQMQQFPMAGPSNIPAAGDPSLDEQSQNGTQKDTARQKHVNPPQRHLNRPVMSPTINNPPSVNPPIVNSPTAHPPTAHLPIVHSHIVHPPGTHPPVMLTPVVRPSIPRSSVQHDAWLQNIVSSMTNSVTLPLPNTVPVFPNVGPLLAVGSQPIMPNLTQVDEAGKSKCKQCGALCANSSSLSRHMKMHKEAPRHNCLRCGQSYYEAWRLARHQRSKHHDDEYRDTAVPTTLSHTLLPSTAPARFDISHSIPLNPDRLGIDENSSTTSHE